MDNTIRVVNDEGQEIVCDILFTFDSDETKKSYIVYTDNSKDEEGNIQVFASVYKPENPKSKLEAIETEKEWKVIETILNNNEDLIKSKTSAEATIYKSIVEKKNSSSISETLKIINKFISESENNKISFNQIYKKLESKPYAIRKGIILILSLYIL